MKRKEICQKVKKHLRVNQQTEETNAYQIMKKSLNAQHAEIYVDLNESCKTLKLNEEATKASSAAFDRTSDNFSSTPLVDVSPSDAISAASTALSSRRPTTSHLVSPESSFESQCHMRKENENLGYS